MSFKHFETEEPSFFDSESVNALYSRVMVEVTSLLSVVSVSPLLVEVQA